MVRLASRAAARRPRAATSALLPASEGPQPAGAVSRTNVFTDPFAPRGSRRPFTGGAVRSLEASWGHSGRGAVGAARGRQTSSPAPVRSGPSAAQPRFPRPEVTGVGRHAGLPAACRRPSLPAAIGPSLHLPDPCEEQGRSRPPDTCTCGQRCGKYHTVRLREENCVSAGSDVPSGHGCVASRTPLGPPECP